MDKNLILNPSVRIKEIQNNLLITNIDTMDFFELNELGSEIIKKVKKEKYTQKIIKKLTQSSTKNKVKAEEIKTYLKKLIKTGIIIEKDKKCLF